MNDIHKEYRPDIDGLRAVAVLSVVLFHLSDRLLPGGFVGVDIFFVISGYLITGILCADLSVNQFSLLNFYARRVRRILPALVFTLVMTWSLAWLILPAREFSTLGKHIGAGAAFAANFILWSEAGYFDSASDFKPLLHLWSLAVEEQFYLFWPLIVAAAWRMKRLLAVVVGLAIISFGTSIWLTTYDKTAAFYSPASRFWELFAGAALVIATSSRSRFAARPWLMDTASIFGLLLIIASVFLLKRATNFPGAFALMPVTGAVLLIFAGQAAFVNRVLLSWSGARYVGKISYPLYLLHWPLLSYSRIEGLSYGYRVAAVVVSFVLAHLVWSRLEHPIRFGVWRAAQRAPVISIGALSVIGALGVVTTMSSGFPSRLPAYVNAILAYDQTFDLKTWRVGDCFKLNLKDYQRNTFGEECLRPVLAPDGRRVILWGDSIAASLYPGIREQAAGRSWRLAQLTTSNCPPFLDFDDQDNTYCRSINDETRRAIDGLRVSTVILSAYWLKYDERGVDIIAHLGKTIDFLRSAGVEDIVLVGPLPRWTPSLPRAIYREWRRTGEVIAGMSKVGLVQSSNALDRKMKDFAQSRSVKYISAIDLLCSFDTCRVSVGASWEDLTSFDSMHLTVPGARYFALKMFLSLDGVEVR